MSPPVRLLLAMFAGVALLNVTLLIAAAVGRRPVVLVPVLGGLAGMIGCLLDSRLRPWAWAPLLLDPSTLGLMRATPSLATEWWQTRSWNRVAAFRFQDARRRVELDLFRSGVFLLRIIIRRDASEPGLSRMSTIGTWCSTPGGTDLQIGDQTAHLLKTARGVRVTSGFPSMSGRPETELAQLELGRIGDAT